MKTHSFVFALPLISILEDVDFLHDGILLVLCKDKRGGRPLSFGGTGVAPCICALKSEAFEWYSDESLDFVARELL